MAATAIGTTAAQRWAEAQFGSAALGDQRRTARAVRVGAALRANPGGSLPEQVGGFGALKAAYRLLDQEDVTFAALAAPHWERTRAAAAREAMVLLVQDLTELDYSAHRATTGLGPIGDGRGRGFLVHSTLAVQPATRQVLGLVQQRPFLRRAAPEGETRTQRRQRERESRAWERAVAAIGAAPTGTRWVDVADCGADIFDFLAACRQHGHDFLVRAYQNRRLDTGAALGDPPAYLLAWARALPAAGERPLPLPARHGRPARTARLHVALAPLTLAPPAPADGRQPLSCWLVRVWEPAPPPDTEPLEWLLLTSAPVTSVADAWERADWYTCRWLVEDYHMCLKTGCRIEAAQLQSADRLFRLLALVAPVAVELLRLRQESRLAPDRPAQALVPPVVLAVVTHLSACDQPPTTIGDSWIAVAKLGGYLGRRRDGPPGWRTLWRGWSRVRTVLEGVDLAASLAICG